MNKDAAQEEAKTVVITGGTRGIGLAIAGWLASRGTRLLLIGRDEITGSDAVRAILDAGADSESAFIRADLSLLSECERVARLIEQSTRKLDALVHCAAAVAWTRRETAEGFEVMFATQFLARYFLSRRLLPLLRGEPLGRIVIVEAVPPARLEMDFDDIQSTLSFSMFTALRKAVLAEHLFAQELARREGPHGVAVNITNPGTTNTDIQRGAPWYIRAVLRPLRPLMNSPERAARNAEELLAREDGATGRLWPDPKRTDVSVQLTHDMQVAERLWILAEQLVGSSLGVTWEATSGVAGR